jgi:cytidylate kinase
MKVDLIKYMSDRYLKEENFTQNPGPVITISRECGCPAKRVAEKLTDLVNQQFESENKPDKWRWVSKELLSESARELDTDPEKIKHVFEYGQKNFIEELLSAHSNKYYKSDRKIKNTIAQVIRSIANDGNAIIVGRGGVAITKDIEKSLHVNLHAPLEWRTIRSAEKHCMSDETAKKYVIDTDKKRAQFRDYFHGRNTDYTWFDVTFNCMNFTVDEMAESIYKIMEIRKLI